MESLNKDYHNVNLEIFRFFNDGFGKTEYDSLMKAGDLIGTGDSNFILFIYIAILIFFFAYNLFKKKDPKHVKEILNLWLTATITVILSLVIGYIFIIIFKNYTKMPRPFCSLDNIYIIHDIVSKLDCNLSFPSGHTFFLTAITASFWHIFNKKMKFFCVLLIIFVAISRIVSGAHYPIDILGAVVITLPLTISLRNIVYKFILYIENKGFFNPISRRIIRN